MVEPSIVHVVAVVNTTRQLFRGLGGPSIQVVPLLACVDLLQAWRSHLAVNVPGWAQSLVFWCKNLSHTPGQLAVVWLHHLGAARAAETELLVAAMAKAGERLGAM